MVLDVRFQLSIAVGTPLHPIKEGEGQAPARHPELPCPLKKESRTQEVMHDGENLEEDYGGPVRGCCPYLWGCKSAKSVVKIELMDRYLCGYPDDALITTGKVRDMNQGGRLRPIPNGEVINFLNE
jgi:DMSO/TMAO reductase YedYZ molybdopterin-dependent catalytic subunit